MKSVRTVVREPEAFVVDSAEWSREEARVLQQIRMMADFLDNRFTIPGLGLRFGWDGLIGLIPGVGDVATTCLAGYIVYLCRSLNLPRRLMWRMAGNVLVDMGLGTIPAVGDLLDVAFRANVRNLRLLEQHLLEREKIRTRKAA